MIETEPTNDRLVRPDVVLELLREQARLYEELEACALRQRDLVAADRVGPLLAILADRQRLSGTLAQTAKRLAPIRKQWDLYRERFTVAERNEADTLLRESGKRLRSVMDGDEKDARVLYGRKQAVAHALKSVHCTSQAMSAYRGSQPETAGRVNEES